MKNVAFGSGLAIIACCHIILAMLLLKLSPSCRALTAFSNVIFLPSRGKKPWLARVFIIGQGPRTVINASVYE